MSEQKTWKALLAVDGSPYSDAAVALTARIVWPPGTIIHTLTVAPERWSLNGLSPDAQRVVDETMAKVRHVERTTAERLAAQAAERLRSHNVAAEPETLEGKPSEVILQRASELPTDLIVIGARGLSAPEEFLLGSTAHKLAHYAECSVLVARPLERERPLVILLAADGSLEAQRAAELLCAFSLPQWAEVIVVGVAEIALGLTGDGHQSNTDMPGEVRQALLDAAEARVADAVIHLRRCGAQVRSVIRLGHPAGEILKTAKEQDADLIVIGARGQTRSTPLPLGGVAQKIVKYAPCSILVAR
jgi:nucleotide-binding universal stress UspA family protein